MFLGEYNHSCDAKNRLRIPPKFRKEFNGNPMILIKGNSDCLFIIPKTQFDNVFERICSVPMFDNKFQQPIRILMSSAVEIEEDGQGRFLLPANLKDFASIKKDVTFVGVGNRIELWADEKWREYVNAANLNFDDIISTLGENGI